MSTTLNKFYILEEIKKVSLKAKERIGTLAGRIFSDWTFSITGALGILGASCSVVGLLVGSAILTSASIVLLSSAVFLGMYHAYTLKPEKNLEDVVEDFNQVNKKFGASTEKLGTNIKNLKTTRDDFKESISCANETGQEIKKTLEEKSKDLKETREKLEETTQKLNSIIEVHKQLEQLISVFHKDVGKFEANNGSPHSVIVKMAALLNHQNQSLSQAQECQNNFQDLAQTLSKNRKQMESLNIGLGRPVSDMQSNVKKVEKNAETIGENTEHLSKVGHDYLRATEKLSQSEWRFSTLLSELKEVVQELNETE